MRIACVGKVRPATVTLPQARWKERVYALSGASSGGGGGPGALGRLLGTVRRFAPMLRSALQPLPSAPKIRSVEE